MIDTQYFGCRCGDHDHTMQVWIDDDPDDPTVIINTGRHWIPWRLRLRECWRILRGRQYLYAETILEPAMAAMLAAALLNGAERAVHAADRHRTEAYL